MKKYMTKHANLFLLAAILLLGMTACSIAESPTTVISASEFFNTDTMQLIPADEPIAAHTVSSIPVSNEVSTQDTVDDLETRLIQVYQKTNPSVVYIITPSGSGSGFVYSQDGYIVTNNHMVSGARSFEVVFANGDRQRAELIGADADSDLAVLQVKRLPDKVTPIPFADTDDLQVGQFVIAIGNPFGEQGSMSFGIVSGLGRSLPSQRELSIGSTYSLPKVIQIDAPINPGNSGGPLLNLDGQVVGVNAAIASETGTNSGVGFSIPVSAVRLIVPQLIENGHYEYPYMGITFDGEISLDEKAQYELPQVQGAYVLSITPGSPADQAGLIAANPNNGQGGDLVVTIDGQQIQNFSALNSYLVFQCAVGQTIQLGVVRDGRQITVPLTLGERP